MRIGVDMHVLQGINQGSKTYLQRLYGAFSRLDTSYQHSFFFDFSKNYDRSWSSRGEVGDLSSKKWRRLTFESNLAAQRHNLDFFHFQYITPLWLNIPSIVTIHDVLFEDYPQYFSKAFALRSKLLYRLSAKRSKRIITVSDYSKRTLVSHFGLDDKLIDVVPNGVDLEFYKNISIHDAKSYVAEKYGISGYVLTTGRLEPRKNHKSLLMAYRHLLDSGVDLPVLVFVGQCDFGYSDIFSIIKNLNLEAYIRHIDDADDEDLRFLYRAANLFVYPSFAEGFGIPPLEAMAASIPTIVSNTTAMGNIFRGSAYMVDPHNILEIASAIKAILKNASLATDLIAKGDLLANSHTWNNSAQNLLKVYEKL